MKTNDQTITRDVSPWERREGETERAYWHFCIYRDMGPRRTLGRVAQQAEVSEKHLWVESAEGKWKERIEAWDNYVQAESQRAYISEVAKRGRRRASVADALLSKAVEALKNFDPHKAKLGEIAMAIKIATDLSRLEDGLETSRVSLEVTDARVILARLPAEVRTPLLRILAERIGYEQSALPAGGVSDGVGSDDGGEPVE